MDMLYLVNVKKKMTLQNKVQLVRVGDWYNLFIYLLIECEL